MGRLTMEPSTHESSIRAVWADALFVSVLQGCDQPSAGQVQQTVARAVCVFGPRGCAELVAQEFGDHPETAVTRMRWARALAAEAICGREAEAACA
jgi:hypothetical protein